MSREVTGVYRIGDITSSVTSAEIQVGKGRYGTIRRIEIHTTPEELEAQYPGIAKGDKFPMTLVEHAGSRYTLPVRARALTP